ncbi:hypothetical protein BDV24DRAFT_129747 [Aspergillus arachidicola]|uniref:Uncharacterized protein n=1 Tax=Aspergillus arachidicola TaxID=656916 RepID=A0A5N6YBC1_9EURO|nr:hypothetical protein BDV24DRAFT_129747 [Aspergillus arachidicola]
MNLDIGLIEYYVEAVGIIGMSVIGIWSTSRTFDSASDYVHASGGSIDISYRLWGT